MRFSKLISRGSWSEVVKQVKGTTLGVVCQVLSHVLSDLLVTVTFLAWNIMLLIL